jgi:hypothetical protein
MTTIEFTDELVFGETKIDAITVAPLRFVALVMLWERTASLTRGSDGSSKAIMQRERIKHQVSFMAKGKRVNPDAGNITQLPITVAKKILPALDIGQGVAGELLNDGDGMNTPVHYKLGTPIVMKQNGTETTISELEFKAEIYGDIEDVLATDGDVPQALALIRKVAMPVGISISLKTLPGWAVDQITTADGVTIMNTVLPRFLE